MGFSESEQKNIGIVIEDYSQKPGGTYKESVTFTASVEGAATSLTSSTTAWEDGVTYAVTSDVTIDGVTVNGTVGLRLKDGVTLTVNNSMTVNSGATLTIEGNGSMNVKGSPAINSISTVIVSSGNLVATGQSSQTLAYRQETMTTTHGRTRLRTMQTTDM